MWKTVFVLIVGCVFAEEYLIGDNVCKVETTETIPETILVPVTKTVRVEEWCLTNFPPRCFKYVNRTVNELQTRERLVKSFKTICCEGFVQENNRCSMDQTHKVSTSIAQGTTTSSTTTPSTTTTTTTRTTTYSSSTITSTKSVLNITTLLSKSVTERDKSRDEYTKGYDVSFSEEKIDIPNKIDYIEQPLNEVLDIDIYPVNKFDKNIDKQEIIDKAVDTDKELDLNKDKKLVEKDDRGPRPKTEDTEVYEQKIIEVTKKINDLSDVSYINHEFSDYDINLVKSHFEKSSKVPELDEATVELHLTTSKNVLLGFVFMIVITILIIIFAVAFVALKCLALTNAANKSNRLTSIFNVPLPDPPQNAGNPCENLYEPIKESPEAIILNDFCSGKFKYNTLSGHYKKKELDSSKSPFFNTLPPAPRSVSYHDHPKSKLDNTFELINPDQVAYDVPPSDSRRFSADYYNDYNDAMKRLSNVTYVDMDGSHPLYVNHIKRKQFTTFLNQQQNNIFAVNDCKEIVGKNLGISDKNVPEDSNDEIRVYSNNEVIPFLSIESKDAQEVLKNLPGFRNGLTATYLNEEITCFQD